MDEDKNQLFIMTEKDYFFMVQAICQAIGALGTIVTEENQTDETIARLDRCLAKLPKPTAPERAE